MMLLQILPSVVNAVVERPPAVPDATDESILGGALNLAFIALACISLIVLVIQGIKYTLSAGEPDRVSAAKGGIIYALVGIAISMTSWSLLRYTLDRVIGETSRIGGTSSLIKLLGNIAAYIAFIGAIIAVIVIFIGIIQLNVSGGNVSSAKKARDRIIYALIGLAVIAAAGPILAFVVDRLQ